METQIAIEPEILSAIHAVERWSAAASRPKTARCRVRRVGVVVELDPETLAAADAGARGSRCAAIAGLLPPRARWQREIGFAGYRNGSAFVGPQGMTADVVFDFERAPAHRPRRGGVLPGQDGGADRRDPRRRPRAVASGCC